MMKKLLLIIFLASVVQLTNAQVLWGVKAGGGTSWVAFPKVFLVDPNDVNNSWAIAPATNSGTFYIGGEVLIPVADHWVFRGELSYNYVSGEVNVDELKTYEQARKLQAYSRIELPLLLTVKSSDDFWFSFGPNIFFNVHDNNGLADAIHELAPDAVLDTKVPWGIRARLATNMSLAEHLYLEIKFDYDLGKHFKFEDNAYQIRMAMQGITGGLTYIF